MTQLTQVRIWTVLALLLGLASCNDGYDGGHGCWNCGPFTPTEISLGLVAGDLTNNGHTTVVTTSTLPYKPRGARSQAASPCIPGEQTGWRSATSMATVRRTWRSPTTSESRCCCIPERRPRSPSRPR